MEILGVVWFIFGFYFELKCFGNNYKKDISFSFYFLFLEFYEENHENNILLCLQFFSQNIKNKIKM